MNIPNLRDADCCYFCKFCLEDDLTYYCNIDKSFPGYKASFKELNRWYLDRSTGEHFVCDLFEAEI